MRPAAHAAVGAAAALVPDVALALFVWRRTWLPPTHPLVRAHRFMGGPAGFGVAVTLGYISHLVADRYSDHQLTPGVYGRRGWRW